MHFLRSKKVLQQDDAQLIEAYKNTSDSFYIGILFDRYSHLVFAVSMKYLRDEDDSKDVVIHIFEKLVSDLKKYKIEHFSNWLYTITKNHCLLLLKKKKLQKPYNDALILFAAEENDEDDVFTNQHFLPYLQDAVESLNAPQRQCVRLFYFDDKSYKEIEVITGFSYDKVKSYIQNGKRNLKIYLEKKNEKR
jgi:RNA polymerase sigma factor (sigma-70 family)